MNDVTLTILKIVISVCSALITIYLIPYLYTLKEDKTEEKLPKDNVEDKKYASLVAMVEVAVKAAEQTFRESGQGAAKKEEVIKFVSEWMTNKGVTISQEQLSQIIECAVYQLKQ